MIRKTCLVTRQYPPQIGGVGHSAYRVANMLADHGFDVHVVVFEKHPVALPFDASYASVQEDKVLVHRVKVFHPSLTDVVAGSETDILTRYNREMFHALEHFQRRYQYEVLHGFFLYPASFISGMVGRLYHTKTIASIRGNDVGKYAFDPLRLPLVRSALDNADYVTSVASSLIDLAHGAITPIAPRAKTILNSVDCRRLRTYGRPELSLHGCVIGTAGLFRYKKGLLYLCKALASLGQQLDFTLLLVGDFFSEADREPHMRMLHEHGLAERTVITGKIPHDRMADYMQLFDIMVFPSLFSEGCPLSMLEGMALQKALVCSRTGAMPEIIRDGENGLLVNPGCSEDIAAAVTTLIEQPALRHELGQRAAETARMMTPEWELGAWLDVYKTIGA